MTEIVRDDHKDFLFIRKYDVFEDSLIDTYNSYISKYKKFLYKGSSQETMEIKMSFSELITKASSLGYNPVFYETVLFIIISCY